MRRMLRLGTHLVVILALAGSMSVIFAPGASSHSPYLSALSDVAAAPAFAATSACANKICGNAPRGLKLACNDNPGTNCKLINGGKDCTAPTAC